MIDLRSAAQLVRLPNLPTAWADICLAALATAALPKAWAPFGLVLLASSCLYCAGMVWNDFFDVEQDRRERPFRPIPSGRVSLRAAACLGTALLVAGLLFAFLAGWVQWATGQASSPWRPVLLAAVLTGCILAYDGWLKKTWLGPVAMGSCRFFNVLLGISVSGALAYPWPLAPHLALVVGLYVAGLTWLARTEARQSNQSALGGATGVMAASLLLALALPAQVPSGTASFVFTPLLVALGFVLGLPIQRAIAAPTPANVQCAVKRCLLGLILLDAILASALAGTPGLLLALLLIPSMLLRRQRWLYAT
jgi:4-hydroxybenzoate polyprenyltransferase